MNDTNNKELSSGAMLQMVTEIVTAYVSNNPVPTAGLPEVINAVHGTLQKLVGEMGEQPPVAQKPAVPVRKSIADDYLVCLEDGKKLKMLKRYLRSKYDMTPEEYRTRWNLPPDYPMVAPSYAAKRSKFAKEIGLGRSSQSRRKKS